MGNKKIKRDLGGMIYSTDSGFDFNDDKEEATTLPPQQQKLMIRLETKQRGGKKATLIKGFVGTAEDMETLSKKIKNNCGTGGSVTEGEILIQGDQVQKVKAFLQGLGYKTNNI